MNFNRGLLSHFVSPRLGLQRVTEKHGLHMKTLKVRDIEKIAKFNLKLAQISSIQAQIYPVVSGVQYALNLKVRN